MENRERMAQITGGFWKARQQLIADKTIYEQLGILKGEVDGLRPDQYSPVVEDFLIAAGLSNKRYKGRVYSDSELAKWIEAAAYSLRNYPDRVLEQEVDALIDLVCQTQAQDGYINTYFQVQRPESKLAHFAFSCELYNMGHLMEAATAYYWSTGKRKFLDAMCRCADLLCRVVGPEQGKLHVYDGHPEIELGLFSLYKATERTRYFDLFAYFLNLRGTQPCFFVTEELLGDNDVGANDKWFGSDHHQAHQQVRLQRDAVGHAVKLTYLYSAITDLVGESGDKELLKAVHSVWDSLTLRRMYVTGGIGSQGYAERFTVDFDLPNDRSYAETCASIGLCFWAKRMLTIERNSLYADVLERALYNGVLHGWSIGGDGYYYTNALSIDTNVSDYREDCKHLSLDRQKWFECACCPPNVLRLVASIEDYCYSVERDTVFVDLYAHGKIAVDAIPQKVTLEIQTDYPYDGLVCVVVKTNEEANFRIALRKPGWCETYVLFVNKELRSIPTQEGYLYLDGPWRNGDVVELRMDMPATYIQADPRVRENRGCVCVMRGPLVYCVEGVDNELLHGLCYSSEETLFPEKGTGVLKDSVVLRGFGYKRGDFNQLYKAYEMEIEKVELVAIPYFLAGNRGKSGMDVWLPIVHPPGK